MSFTLAGLLLLAAAFAGLLDVIGAALSVRKHPRKPQISTGRRFIHPEARDERTTTR